MHVLKMACPRYPKTSCLCRSPSFVTPSYHIFLLRCRCLRITIDRAIVSATSPGLGFPHPLSPCTYVRFREAVFSARIFPFFFAKIADDRQQTTCGPAAQHLPHSSSSRQHHVCAHGVSSLSCGELFMSEPAICHPTIPHLRAVLPLPVHVHIMSTGVSPRRADARLRVRARP